MSQRTARASNKETSMRKRVFTLIENVSLYSGVFLVAVGAATGFWWGILCCVMGGAFLGVYESRGK